MLYVLAAAACVWAQPSSTGTSNSDSSVDVLGGVPVTTIFIYGGVYFGAVMLLLILIAVVVLVIVCRPLCKPAKKRSQNTTEESVLLRTVT